ncbi:MAG: hypothetical protein GXP08_12170 [Gammaproteobacteria bacterium]|nr:hypothetical protein [Gammaproteobacteria bacterium]
MGNSGLKKLAKAYAIGEITKYDYRQQRSDIIDEITDYSGPIEEASPRTLPFKTSANQEENAAKDNYDTAFNNNANHPGNVGKHKPSSGFRLIFVFSALTLAVFIFFKTNTEFFPENPATEISPTFEPDPQQLVENFVNKNEWNQNDIAEFLINWARLSDVQKQRAQQAVWFQNLVDSLRKRQMEQKALADIGANDAQQKEIQIRLLAESLDIYL